MGESDLGRISEAPQSTKIMEMTHAVVVGTERVPEESIAGVVVNERARNWLPSSLRYLASEEYLRNSVQMTVPAEKAARKVLVSGYWGRAIPLAYGCLPFADRFVGGTVMGKGSSLSGWKLHDRWATQDTLTPWGFFGEREAGKEIRIANVLLENGFRAALPLGYAVLKAEEIRAWLLSRWKKERDVAAIIERSIGLISGKGDSLAYLVRITGVSERWRRFDFQGTNFRFDLRRKAEMARAARLLLAESNLFPESFGNYLRNTTRDQAKRVLGKIGEREKLADKDFLVFFDLGIGILTRNAVALDKAVSALNNSGVTFDEAGEILSASKDLDFAFFIQDHEGTKEIDYPSGMPPDKRQVRRYITMAGENFAIFLQEDLIPNWLSKPGDSQKWLGRKVREQIIARIRQRAVEAGLVLS